jgi:hypothetical protein
MSTNEDDQFYKLMLAYRIAEKANSIKNERINNYEILQNNYINDVLIALTGIYFFKENLTEIRTIEDLIEKQRNLKGQAYLRATEKYILSIGNDFEDFILKEIKILQNILDVKKEAKKEFTNTDWIPNDTNNWLKKDGTYKDIYGKVIKKLKEN